MRKLSLVITANLPTNVIIKPPPSPLPKQVPGLLGRAQIFTSEALSSPGLSLSSVSTL